ncbi:MAG: tetratricopeptide repeat protein [Spirochaetaceae bacterium]|jgi:tetratricopeptide (TPR) repeat protein|nr:tetratricopeptide repeat protein [Spirochaetaceae bacterium]
MFKSKKNQKRLCRILAFGIFALYYLLLSLACTSPPPAPAAATALKPAPKPAPVSPKADVFTERVYAKLAAGDIEGALGLFDALPAEEAQKSNVLLMKAAILFSAQRLKEARDTIAKVLESSADKNDTIEAQFVLSNIEGLEGQPKAQKALLDTILKTDPKFIPALNKLGSLALNNNQYKAAAGYFDSVLKIQPQNMDALVGRAGVYRFERKPKEAVRCLNEAIAAYPEAAEPLAQRGRVYREMGEYNKSLADLDNAKKLDGSDYWIAYDRARTLLALDSKKEALNEFERAEKLNPQIFVSYVYSAGIRDDMEDYKNAMHDYERLVKINPDYYFGFEMLGAHYMREKRYADARDAFKSAYARAPEDYNYALLAVVNGLYAGDKQALYKPYIEEILRKIDKSSPYTYMLRLFYDFSGDSETVRKINSEKNNEVRARNLFYLANYYMSRGLESLAEKVFDEFKELKTKNLLEWRIYEWAVETGTLKTATRTAQRNS